MSEWIEPILNVVADDPTYQAYQLTMLEMMKVRSCNAAFDLKRVFDKLGVPLDRTSIAWKGSYGRGQPGLFSDIDLVIILGTNSNSTMVTESQVEHLLPNRKISIAEYSALDTEHEQNLWFWLAMTSLRFVDGNKSLFTEFQSEVRNRLSQLALTIVFSIYSQDPLHSVARHDPLSPFNANIKRGHGGIIEYEFTKLLQMRQEVKRQKMPEEQIGLLARIDRHYGYLILLREYFSFSKCRPLCSYVELSDEFEQGHWFFLRTIATRVAAEFHDLVCEFVASVPSEANVPSS